MPKLCPMTPREMKGHKTHSFQIIPQDPGPQSTKPFVLSRTAANGNSSVCEKCLEQLWKWKHMAPLSSPTQGAHMEGTIWPSLECTGHWNTVSSKDTSDLGEWAQNKGRMSTEQYKNGYILSSEPTVGWIVLKQWGLSNSPPHKLT